MAKTIRGDGWSLTIDGDQLLLKLSDMAPELDRQLRFAFRDMALDIPVAIQKRMEDYRKGKRSASSPIMVRSGALSQSVRGKRAGSTARDLAAIIFAGGGTAPYARQQEFGATIRPKSGGYLTVPLDHILTDAGLVKGEYELYERGGVHQTGSGKPTWISGRAIMIEENGRPVPIYALITEAKIPPRLRMGETIRDHDQWIVDRLLDAFEKAVPKK